jgi:hypothetical protein
MRLSIVQRRTWRRYDAIQDSPFSLILPCTGTAAEM